MSTLDRAFLKAYRQAKSPPTRSLESPANGLSAPHWGAALPAASPVTPPAVSVPTAEEVVELRARYELPRIPWPALIGSLTTAAAHDFAPLANLLSQRSRSGRRVVCITSHARGEGRTTVALAVTRLVGSRGLRVALVDADFRHPGLAAQLNLLVATGWDDTLAGDQPLDEALIESLAERVTLVPLRGAIPDPGALIGHVSLPRTIDALRRNFELVILDAGPLGNDGEAIEWAALFSSAPLDDALIVRDTGRTTDEQLKHVGRRLAAAGIGHWDVAENFLPGGGLHG